MNRHWSWWLNQAAIAWVQERLSLDSQLAKSAAEIARLMQEIDTLQVETKVLRGRVADLEEENRQLKDGRQI